MKTEFETMPINNEPLTLLYKGHLIAWDGNEYVLYEKTTVPNGWVMFDMCFTIARAKQLISNHIKSKSPIVPLSKRTRRQIELADRYSARQQALADGVD